MSRGIREFIIQTLEKKSPLPAKCDVDAYNYIDSGHIDSIAIIKFILDLEGEFRIDLTPEEIESTGFRTIGGLISIIESKRPQ